MPRALAALSLLLWCACAGAQDAARYVSDELVLVLRDAPRAEGAPRGVVTSGMRVQVLETDAASGYARIRTPDNREGWILARYLKTVPVARERLQRVEKELAQAQAELAKVREDHERLLKDFARISGGEPVASRELMAEAEHLRQQMREKDQEGVALRARYDEKRATQQTLLIGGALVAAGFVLALLLRWLWPKRRWGEF